MMSDKIEVEGVSMGRGFTVVITINGVKFLSDMPYSTQSNANRAAKNVDKILNRIRL